MDSENDFLSQGVERLQAGEYEAALIFLDQAIVQNPQQANAWYQKGLALQKLGCYTEAVVANKKFMDLTADLEKVDKAPETLNYSLLFEISQQTNLTKQWYEIGNQQRLSGDFEGAVVSYGKSLESNPDHLQALCNRGIVLFECNRYEEAIASFDKALEIKSDSHEVCYNRGSALFNLNRHEEAIASFDKALEIKPDDQEVWDYRGRALGHLNCHEEAVISFDKALEMKPDDHVAWYNRGNALDHLNRYEEAISSCDKALEIKPDSHKAWINRGSALWNLNRYEEAIANYDKALEFKPDLHFAWGNRGILVLLSPAYSQFPALVVGAILSQQNPQLDQRGYPGQLITLEAGLTQVVPQSEGWCFLQLTLGIAHFGQSKREQQRRNNPGPYWQKAMHCLDLALSVLSVEAFPELRLETLQFLIRVLLAQGDPTTAQAHRKAGVELLQTLLNQAPTAAQKQRIEAKFSDFSQIEVDVWLQSGEPITALETAERYKNRCLTWILDAWKETVIWPKYADMQVLCTPDTAIIYWHLSPDSLSTFLLTDGGNAPNIIDFNRTVQAQQLADWMQAWNNNYRDYASQKITGTEGENHPWRENIVSLLDDLRQKILQIDTICQKLPATVKNLILVPHRDLHLLPIHTLFHDYCCTYLPSIQIGLTQRERPSQNETYTPLLSIEDPATEQPPMPFAQLEFAIIRHLVKSATCVKSSDATTDKVLKSVQKSFSTFHFTGHGAYNSRNPADSALALTDGLLTAKDISQLDLSSYKLIVLAACETALTGNDGIKTEYVGLSSAFLKAGATNVLSTLWPVDEISSTWLTIRFYQFLLTGNSPRIALNRAQTWLKTVTWQQLADWIIQLNQLPGLNQGHVDLLTPRAKNTLKEGTIMRLNQPTKYSHPYYWAAFTLTGRG
jgi:CHAT domain-containing protein/Flp pilus assembly protein TadD